MTAVALFLALAATGLTNVAYLREHDAAAALPALSLRRPLHSIEALLTDRSWLLGFALESGGFALYVGALALAPRTLVQSVSAGGIGILAYASARLSRRRLSRHELAGVLLSMLGLLALAVSLAGGSGEGPPGPTAARRQPRRSLSEAPHRSKLQRLIFRGAIRGARDCPGAGSPTTRQARTEPSYGSPSHTLAALPVLRQRSWWMRLITTMNRRRFGMRCERRRQRDPCHSPEDELFGVAVPLGGLGRNDWRNGLSLEGRCYCDRHVGSANHPTPHPVHRSGRVLDSGPP
jgi:hypothetical protein